MTDADVTFAWAARLVNGLAMAGVRRVVLSPGSRSTPLALAALRQPALQSHVVVDERSAAFFALGLAKALAAPVGVVATSGSAIANWFPAVVEADMARVPLLLLSADRPPELHDCGANQTTDQIRLFGHHVRAFHQLPPPDNHPDWLTRLAALCIAESVGPLPGPVQINVPLREPLVPSSDRLPTSGPNPPKRLAATLQPDRESIDILLRLIASGPGAIVCGPDNLGSAFRFEVGELSRRLRVPLFADILSSLRFDRDVGDAALAFPDQVSRRAPTPAWILRFGGMPVSRAIAQWMDRCRRSEQIVVSAHPRVADPDGTATHVIHADPAALCASLAGEPAPPTWRDEFLRLDGEAASDAEAICENGRAFEGAVLRSVLHALPDATPVFVGNSLAVRFAEWFAGRGSRTLRIFGNRGASGIDGNLSTAFGISAALGGRVLAVVGDLAFLHDLNALALVRHGSLVVLLLDNGGGAIFDHLPQAALPEYEQAWLTPQAMEPAAAAQAFGLDCCRVECAASAASAVVSGLSTSRSRIVHVPIDRAHSLAQVRAFHSAGITRA